MSRMDARREWAKWIFCPFMIHLGAATTHCILNAGREDCGGGAKNGKRRCFGRGLWRFEVLPEISASERPHNACGSDEPSPLPTASVPGGDGWLVRARNRATHSLD